MFFDEQVAKPVTADPFSLESLVAWLEKQPAGQTYCYTDHGYCLLGQYFAAHGYKDVQVFSDPIIKHAGCLTGTPYPREFNKIALGNWNDKVHTFGAALSRARALQGEQKGAER